MGLRYYANAPATTLASSCTNVATTMVVTATTGFPITYPYTLIVDRGLATEEVVSVTNAAGTTLTVTRGYDSTTGFAHSAGASVVHGFSAIDPREANAHVNATTGVHGIAGAVVGTTDAQTLTNKTLGTTNVINGFTASRFMEADGTGKIVSGSKTIPTGTVVGTSDAQTLTTKTIALGSNTVSGTKAQFDTACTDADFASLAGTETLTNKTLTTPQIAQINSTTGNLASTTHEGVASAVNYVRHVNSATGGAVSVGAGGTDANVSINLFSKGTGSVLANGNVVVDVSSTQTLTNKTLTTPVIGGSTLTQIQKGNATCSFSASAGPVTQAVTFAQAFSVAPEVSIGSQHATTIFWATSITTTGFTLNARQYDSTARTLSAVASWIAMV